MTDRMSVRSSRSLGLRWDGLVLGILFVAFAVCGPGLSNAAGPVDPSRAALVEGVSRIAVPGVPGPLAVFGPQAFPVITADVGDECQAPVVAAGLWAKGRVVAFGHANYFDAKSLSVADTGRLVLNAVRWAARSSPRSNAKIRVIAWRQVGLAAFLKDHGMEAETGGARTLGPMGSAQVLCLSTHHLTEPADRDAVAAFVKRGGGLLAEGLGWGWLQLHSGKTLADHPGNQLLAPAGLVWLDGSVRSPKEGLAVGPVPAWCHGGETLAALTGKARGNALAAKSEVQQATWTLTHLVQALPQDDKFVRPGLQRLTRESAGKLVPTRQRPLKASDPVSRLAVAVTWEDLKHTDPDKVPALPAAEQFPGPVPAGAKRITQSLTIDGAMTGWQSTGLYAVPGEPITVSVADPSAAQDLVVRIGSHSDRLWDKDSWRRWPEITTRTPLAGVQTKAANPFGGLVYLEAGRKARPKAIEMTIAGAVAAPYFIQGRTTVGEWQETIRSRPGPWAELATSKVILTVPSSAVRTLDDPVRLLEFWDSVLDACAELAGIPAARPRPQRYVADLQISLGAMHSGYPIMTHLDAVPAMLDRDLLTTTGKGWGLFHEMGHNHQSGDWTFDGTVEVTCNLFSLYVLDKLTKCPADVRHRAFSAEARRSAWQAYREAGCRFDEWKAKPFLALSMYAQLIDAFGWDRLKEVIAGYRSLPDGQRPTTEADKRDQWMIRYSRAVGRNLGPFFEAWGVPVTATAKAAVAQLPGWMPPGM